MSRRHTRTTTSAAAEHPNRPRPRRPTSAGAGGAGIAACAIVLASSCAFNRTPGTAENTPPPDAGTWVAPRTVAPCKGLCNDFPAAPIVVAGTPANVPAMFHTAGVGAGPCITEPEDGTLFPNNWLRPRVKVTAPGATAIQITFHSSKQANDLVVYTAANSWTLDKATWWALAGHVVDEPIQVSVRAITAAGPTTASTSSFTIAPVVATGKMVYWALRGFDATKSDNTELFGFGVGDERVASVLKVPQVQQTTSGASFSCIGCHTATPDGAFVGFTGNYPWTNAVASVEAGSTGEVPGFLGTAGVDTITRDWRGILSFSAKHWATGDHIAITSQGAQAVDPNANLVWMELDSGATGTLARQGDPAGAAAPNFSHDGSKIVYTSTNANQDGRLGVGTADLYVVPYGDRAGGVATKIAGAAEPDFAEYYPALSPDDSLIAFNRLSQADANVSPTGAPYDGGMYFNPAAEVWLVPAAGGAATRLRANDAPACTPAVVPNPRVYPNKTGWDNSWAKWSPQVGAWHDKKYYWIIFSSYRYDVSPPRGQLYMTAVVTSAAGVTTYPAVYLWNQDIATSNHTPAWEAFQIPPIL